MTTTPLPPWKFERVIDGIPCVPTVEAEHNMQAYATQARADLEAENADLKRKLAEASNTLCIGGQMISAIAAELKGNTHD